MRWFKGKWRDSHHPAPMNFGQGPLVEGEFLGWDVGEIFTINGGLVGQT